MATIDLPEDRITDGISPVLFETETVKLLDSF